MINFGINRILSMYCNYLDSANLILKNYFRNRLIQNCNKDFQSKISLLVDLLEELGFKKTDINYYFSNYLDNKRPIEQPIDLFNYYNLNLHPVILELFLNYCLRYLINEDISELVTNLKSKNLLPLEFLFQLSQLKSLLKKDSRHVKNLENYLLIRENFITFLNRNKERILLLQNEEYQPYSIQLLYLLYRQLEFFNLQDAVDFRQIKIIIKENMENYLQVIPLVTLKNPDIYYCALYLVKKFKIDIDILKVKNFLENLYMNIIDEFDAPFIQATRRLYFLLKSNELFNFSISSKQIEEISYAEDKFFKSNYLRNLETSRLIIILKMYKLLNLDKIIDQWKIKALMKEIEIRITPEGIFQNRGDQIISSEATYYSIFYYQINNSLEKLKNINFIEYIIAKIYRNMKILEIHQDSCCDLLSELLYSFEALKLINCVNSTVFLSRIVQYVFPEEINLKIKS